MEVLTAEVIREALYYLSRWQNKTLLIGFASIGSIKREDVDFLVEDVRLLCGLGMKICVGGKQFLPIFNDAGCDCFKISSGGELARKAVEIGATKLCLLSGVDRIKTTAHGDLDDLSIAQAEEVITTETDLSLDARGVLQLAVSACRQGVPRVHLINAHHQGALLDELFTCRGAGVMVYSETALYKEVRPAQTRDITAIMRLVFGERQVVNAAYRSSVTSNLGEFVVFAVDDEVYGCGRLSITPDGLRVTDLANGNRFKGSIVLKSLLEYAILRAVAIHASCVSVPAHNVPPLMAIMPWFSHLGFVKQDRPGQAEKFWVKAIFAV